MLAGWTWKIFDSVISFLEVRDRQELQATHRGSISRSDSRQVSCAKAIAIQTGAALRAHTGIGPCVAAN
jgi:hypothetical protein